jgi:hypothetical protein
LSAALKEGRKKEELWTTKSSQEWKKQTPKRDIAQRCYNDLAKTLKSSHTEVLKNGWHQVRYNILKAISASSSPEDVEISKESLRLVAKYIHDVSSYESIIAQLRRHPSEYHFGLLCEQYSMRNVHINFRSFFNWIEEFIDENEISSDQKDSLVCYLINCARNKNDVCAPQHRIIDNIKPYYNRLDDATIKRQSRAFEGQTNLRAHIYDKRKEFLTEKVQTYIKTSSRFVTDENWNQTFLKE